MRINDNHQAIITRYIGPTDTKGSRVRATSASGLTLTLGWDSALGSEENHRAAALALANKHNWLNRPNTYLVSGGLKTGNAYVIIEIEND